MRSVEPSYISLFKTGELAQRAQKAKGLLQECRLCPRGCGSRRLEGEAGKCLIGRSALVSSFFAHRGEEDCIRGFNGSGTIFFSGCNLRCIFCQNSDISWSATGQATGRDGLANIMLQLQATGAHNINFVTPSHVVAHILEALDRAVSRGLCIPLVYNSSGYDSLEALRLLDGVIDIYMPDLKFMNPSTAQRLTAASDYPSVARQALREMFRQVGDLELDQNGLARRGLLVRHLVLPNDLAGTREAMEFLAREISPHTCVNLMAQYHPCGLAWSTDGLGRRITRAEFEAAVRVARQAGLYRFA